MKYIFYNGEKIIDYNITFYQMIKPFDKDNNEINILAYDVERNDSICSVKENEIPLIQSAKNDNCCCRFKLEYPFNYLAKIYSIMFIQYLVIWILILVDYYEHYNSVPFMNKDNIFIYFFLYL